MAGIKLQKRENDFFVSYGHSDLARIIPLVEFLRRVCGIRLWFDGLEGNAAVRSSELLGAAIGNARGILVFLSEAWTASTWCKNEYEVSLSEQRAHSSFEIVCVRLDHAEPPSWLNSAEIVNMRENNPSAVAALLRSLSSDTPHRFDNLEDIYLAAPWNRPSSIALTTLKALRRTGWRLVGDTPNLKHLGEKRIESIQRTTKGVIALLPYDPSQQEGSTSPYILQEVRLAAAIGKPVLLLIEPGVIVPKDIVQIAFRENPFELKDSSPAGQEKLDSLLEEFDGVLQHAIHSDNRAYIFFASSLRGDPREADDIATVIERASNMRCMRGERVSGSNVQAAIIDLIKRAAVVIADVSDDHRNTLIEAGIAMGAGTLIKLLCREPAEGLPLKKRFMLEGQELYWYRTPEEKIGLCYFFARQFRRQIYIVR